MNDSILGALPKAQKIPETAAPARSPREAKKAASGTRLSLSLLLLGALACAVVAFAVFYAGTSPAVASLIQSGPTSTVEAYSVRSNLLKPSVTPSPTVTFTPVFTFTPTATNTPLPTETPGLAEVSVLVDTPVPTRSYVEPAQAAASYSGSKYILVDISEQHMYVYEGDTLIWSFVASTGMNNATRTGVFAVQSKIPNAYGATWNIWMPNWLGIYWAGGLENGIHALPILPNGQQLWAGLLGRPISYGCVVLSAYESTLLYQWAEIGTPVEIQW